MAKKRVFGGMYEFVWEFVGWVTFIILKVRLGGIYV